MANWKTSLKNRLCPIAILYIHKQFTWEQHFISWFTKKKKHFISCTSSTMFTNSKPRLLTTIIKATIYIAIFLGGSWKQAKPNIGSVRTWAKDMDQINGPC